tara:strand:+ start:7341 stop:7817 length:477 start_codon:yes stop_codon:yes gene_type:complete
MVVACWAATSNSNDNDEFTIEYETTTEGQRTTYSGSAVLYMSEDQPTPCISYVMDLVDGELSGPTISGDPGQPILPFDSWQVVNGSLVLIWCETASEYQSLPVMVPRGFTFDVVRTTYSPEDLLELLEQWGGEGSWDLNGDGMVDGQDLAQLLAHWNR